jgi:hypothetical protein
MSATAAASSFSTASSSARVSESIVPPLELAAAPGERRTSRGRLQDGYKGQRPADRKRRLASRRGAASGYLQPGRTVALLAAAAVVLIAAAPAGASAVPVSPAAGASTTGHPIFVWSLPSGETSEALRVASKPDVTPSGEFFEENVVDFGDPGETDTRWQPTSPLYAGNYWWSVETFASDPFAVLYMPPSPFTVAAIVKITKLKVQRDTELHEATFTVGFAANTKPPETVVLRVKRGRKVLWTHTDSAAYGGTYSTWNRPRAVKQGTKLVVVATLKADAAIRTLSKPFRAP